MPNRIAQSIVKGARRKASARERGTFHSLVETHASRMVRLEVADLTRLPVVVDPRPLMNGSGQFIWLAGYSEVGGGDVAG